MSAIPVNSVLPVSAVPVTDPPHSIRNGKTGAGINKEIDRSIDQSIDTCVSWPCARKVGFRMNLTLALFLLLMLLFYPYLLPVVSKGPQRK